MYPYFILLHWCSGSKYVCNIKLCVNLYIPTSSWWWHNMESWDISRLEQVTLVLFPRSQYYVCKLNTAQKSVLIKGDGCRTWPWLADSSNLEELRKMTKMQIHVNTVISAAAHHTWTWPLCILALTLLLTLTQLWYYVANRKKQGRKMHPYSETENSYNRSVLINWLSVCKARKLAQHVAMC